MCISNIFFRFNPDQDWLQFSGCDNDKDEYDENTAQDKQANDYPAETIPIEKQANVVSLLKNI